MSSGVAGDMVSGAACVLPDLPEAQLSLLSRPGDFPGDLVLDLSAAGDVISPRARVCVCVCVYLFSINTAYTTPHHQQRHTVTLYNSTRLATGVAGVKLFRRLCGDND